MEVNIRCFVIRLNEIHCNYLAVSLAPNRYSSIYVVLSSSDFRSLSTNSSLFSTILSALIPSGSLYVVDAESASRTLVSDLTLTGFTAISTTNAMMTARKPSFAQGMSISLRKANIPKTVSSSSLSSDILSKKALWTFTSPSTPTIDPESLLTQEDKVRPMACAPVNGSAPRRKRACKNCSCGLAELEEEDRRNGKIVILDGAEDGSTKEISASEKNTMAGTVKATDKATSSCGSCFLGDAFRCASCPYLGQFSCAFLYLIPIYIVSRFTRL